MPKLRTALIRELSEIYDHMRRDFPASERVPYLVLRKAVLQGAAKAMLLLEDTGGVCGYAICVVMSEHFHIQYVAILPEHRSKGYGSLFLKLLQKRFGGKNILLEVEDPGCAQDEEDRVQREKRIRFYRRAGLRMLDGMKLTLFGIPMLCMTSDKNPLSDPERLWLDCYRKMLGSRSITRFVVPKVFRKDTGEDGELSSEYASSIRPGRYRHFKGGEYRMLYLARHSETREVMVVYQALYGDKGIWVRPASMWVELVDQNGEQVPRFSWITED